MHNEKLQKRFSGTKIIALDLVQNFSERLTLRLLQLNVFQARFPKLKEKQEEFYYGDFLTLFFTLFMKK